MTIIEVSPEERTFDWRSSNDPGKERFPYMASAAPVPTPTKQKEWAGPYVRLDQGREGACVGFGFTDEALSTPNRVRPPESGSKGAITVDVANRFALKWYHTAQGVDEWPGSDYDGTSVNAGAKTAKAWGYVDEYRWARNMDDLRAAVANEGPVPIGIPWYSNMYRTTSEGLVVVGGDIVGGHCILVNGWYPRRNGVETYRWLNSWGPGYGKNGMGWIKATDLETLVFGTTPQYGQGEACVLIGRHTSPTLPA